MRCIFPVELVRRAHCSDEEKMQLESFVQKILLELSQFRSQDYLSPIDEDRKELAFVHEVYFGIKQGNDIDKVYIQPLLQSSYFGRTLLVKLISIVAAVGILSRDSRRLLLIRIASLGVWFL